MAVVDHLSRLTPATGPAPAERSDGPDRRRWLLVAATLAVGLVHVAVVARRYHVGSFDDDAAYVMLGRAVAAGHGLTSRLAGGYPLVGVYPPGYPALVSPLVALWPASVTTFRLVSLASYVALFPLSDAYLRRLDVGAALRAPVLLLLSLSPVLASYATMAMPETTFVAAFLVLVLLVSKWEKGRTWWWAAPGTVAAAAGLLWLKEAGLGLVIGVALWLALRRRRREAGAVVAGAAALIAPLLIVRRAAGAALIGSRYSKDFAGAYHGGLLGRVTYYGVDGAWSYFSKAVPRTIVPIRSGFLPSGPPVSGVLSVLTWTAAPLVMVGVAVWWRRQRDASGVAVLVYLAATLLYPYINERRLVLVLPVLLLWYVLGAHAAYRFVSDRARRAAWRAAPAVTLAVALVSFALVATDLGSQFTRHYLYFEGASSSAPGGSPYMAMLRRLGAPQEAVETDYLWTTALYGRRSTRHGSYLAPCDLPSFEAAVASDHAGYLLTAALNGGGPVDVPCILPTATSFPGAVRLMRTGRDKASVFELVGPGTAHPALADRAPDASLGASPGRVAPAPETPQGDGDPGGTYPTTTAASPGGATLTWSWPAPVALTQVSVGGVGAVAPAATSRVTMSVLTAAGELRPVATAPGAAPFLVASFPEPLSVTAVSVTVSPAGAGTVAVHDFHALGPAGTSP